MKKFLTFLFAVMLVLTCCALIGCDGEEDNTQTSTEPEKTAVSLELSGSLTEDGNVLKDSAFPDDITLKIVYSDNTKGEEVAVTAEMVSGFDTSTEGRKTATVSYEELEASIPYRVYSNEMQLNFYDGAGSEGSPYQITTAEELQNVSLSLSSYFVLNNDIDLTDKEWEPIGNNIDENSAFSGNFDGKGHKISNLTVTEIKVSTWESYKNTYNYAGLFGVVTGQVKDLKLEDCTVLVTDEENKRRGDVYAGVLAGANFGTITNVTVSDSTVNVKAWLIASAGGLVGSNVGTVTACAADGATVTAVSDGWTANAGGLIGASGDRLYWNVTATVSGSKAENCTVLAKVNDATTKDEIDYPSSSTYFGRAYSGGLGGLKVVTTLSENSVSNNTYTAESYATGDYILFTGEQWGY